MQVPHLHLSLSNSHWTVSLCRNLHAVGVILLVHQQTNALSCSLCKKQQMQAQTCNERRGENGAEYL